MQGKSKIKVLVFRQISKILTLVEHFRRFSNTFLKKVFGMTLNYKRVKSYNGDIW